MRITALLAFVVIASAAEAQATSISTPPPNGKKLAEILAKVEGRDKFKFISEIEWSQNGFYDIYYYTTDNVKVELHMDPVFGDSKLGIE